MATSQTGKKEDRGELTEIKRKLAWRMAFAVLMIVALLGGLALFDYLTGQVDTDNSAPQFTEPVPVSKKTITQALTSAESPPGPVKDSSKESVPESTAAPVDKSMPLLDEPPPRPEVAAQPALPRASQRTARPLGQAVSAASPRSADGKPAPAPVSPVRTEQAQTAAAPQPALPRLFSGYAVQAGVFADPRRAEELHAKLTLEGIPSTIEARVQVGPFKTRAEAEAARVKMKALGIDAVMLLPKGVKR